MRSQNKVIWDTDCDDSRPAESVVGIKDNRLDSFLPCVTQMEMILAQFLDNLETTSKDFYEKPFILGNTSIVSAPPTRQYRVVTTTFALPGTRSHTQR